MERHTRHRPTPDGTRRRRGCWRCCRVLLCTVSGQQTRPFTVRPPPEQFWSFAAGDNLAAASELTRASRAVLHAQRLAFDPNLPAGLNLPPREIAGVADGRGADPLLGRPPLQDVPARELPLVAPPPLDEVDIVMPLPPQYRTAFRPGAGNFSVDPLDGAPRQPRTDCALELPERYKLSRYEIEHVLPKADTLYTSIAEICPDFASPIKCHPKTYRRIDGLCNNVKFPNWGATRRQFQRLLEPVYPDGIDRPNIDDMPSPRIVSATVHKDRDLFDHASTLMMIAWGQFMDHDFTLTFTRPDERTLNEPEDCCRNSGPQDCLPISVPRDDRFFSRYGVDCINFVRGQPGIRQFCRLGSRSGFNVLTSVIDGGTVYGGTDEAARCFLAGEIRVNEQLILSTMHLTWFREHNRICAILKKLNPHWDDERLYQETRRIVIACIQHITFNEFLPMLLGKRTMQEHDLILQDHGYWDGYNEYEDPSITLGFMTSAYRFGHSLLPTVVEKWSPTHKYIAERNLADLIRRPFDLYEPGAVDEYILGQLNQPAMAMDFAITEEVTNMLFRQPNEEHGIDLVSLNLQRAREMGVPGYMHYRKWCGLPTTGHWPELREYVSNHTAGLYSELYRSPWDIDLFSGGISERPLPSSMVGPTFACIIAAQMHKVRHGDRFWYELGGQPSSFTPDQLQQIRRVQLSRVLCDNTDRIRTIQVYPLVLPDYDANPRVACDSGVLPHVDLNYWREDPH
ncbi:Chorion peroxidase [Amphibalanus amphitrite]|uniref:Chorion peroxidase n=1 Tax=Amphibalanus amphitrite TaxID=1232801 RepID=A0A6A4VLQ4_AMPAM|nr:Chorion peroxidase [Amphibalanus amphitrite]